MRGVLLDRYGRPDGLATVAQAARGAHGPERRGLEAVYESLRLSREHGGPFEPRGSSQSWREVLRSMIADGTAITSASETIMVPDFTIPAGYMYPGRTLKYTLFGRQSTVITTPGTITLRLRWGGVGGTALAASGAFAPDPTAAATNLTVGVEWYVVCRAVGSSGSLFAVGTVEWSDYDDATVATIVGNLNMRLAPTATPAAVTVNTDTANALSPTYQSSVATASFTNHIAILEALT